MTSNSKQIFYISTGKILAVVASFILPLLLTRYLTKSEYGIYNQFSTVVSFLTMFFAFGMASNIYYFAFRVKKELYSSLIVNTHLLLFLGSFLALIFITFPNLLSVLIEGKDIFEFKYYILLTVIVAIPTGILQPLFITRKNINASLLYPVSEPILKVILVLLAVIFFKGIKSIIIAVFILYLLQYTFTLIYSFKLVSITKKVQFSLSLLKKQIKYSLPLGLANSTKVLMQSFDKLIIIGFVSSAQYATYAVAFFGIPGIIQIYGSFSQVYVIEMTKEFKKNNFDKIIILHKELISKIISFTMPIVFGVALYAEKIIALLFTDKYTDSVPYFRIYILTLVFQIMGNGLIIRASGKTKGSLYSYLLTALFILPSTYFLVKYFSLWGAMSGAVMAILIPRILLVYFDTKILNCGLFTIFPIRNMIKIFFISSLAIIPFYLIDTNYEYSIIIAILFGISYLGLNIVIQYYFGVFIFEEKLKMYINKYIKN